MKNLKGDKFTVSNFEFKKKLSEKDSLFIFIRAI